MNDMNLMIITMVLAIIINLFTVVFFAVKGRNQILFGCVVSEEIRNNKESKKLIKRFFIENIAVTFISIIILLIGAFINKEGVIIASIFVAIIGTLIIYTRYNKKMRMLKSYLGGLKGKKQVVVVDFKSQKYTLKRILTYGLITVPFIIFNAIILITNYDSLPNKIARQYDLKGNATSYMDKSYLNLSMMLITIVVCSLIFVSVDYVLFVKPFEIDPSNVEKSKEGNLKYKREISNMMIFCTIITMIILTIGNLNILNVIQNIKFVMVTVSVLMILLLILVLYFSYRAYKVRNSYKGKEKNFIKRDDDEYWKLGFIYYNKEDPSIMVEKRVGIGWTINAGNKVGMAIYIAILLLIVGSIITTII